MRIARTYDLALVSAILTHPRIWDHIGDDYAPPREGFCPNSDSRIWWVTAREDAELLGLFMFLPRSTVLWEAHVSMLPCAWGSRGLTAGRSVVQWLWRHSTARRLIAEVPESNTLAIRYADACGLKQYGRNPASYMKHGKLEDLILMGVSRNF